MCAVYSSHVTCPHYSVLKESRECHSDMKMGKWKYIDTLCGKKNNQVLDEMSCADATPNAEIQRDNYQSAMFLILAHVLSTERWSFSKWMIKEHNKDVAA